MDTVTVAITVKVDIAKWAAEYSMETLPAAVREDARSYLQTMVQECSAGQAGLITIEEG